MTPHVPTPDHSGAPRPAPATVPAETPTTPAGAEQPIRVLAVDDDPMVLDLIRVMLKPAPDIDVVAIATDGDEVVDACIAHRPDVVLMDVRMRRMDGIDATAALTKRPEAPKVIILTTFDQRDDVPKAMHAGAAGFILKSTARDDLYRAIRDAHAGRTPMSSQSAAHLRADYLAASTTERRTARERMAALTDRERNIALLVAQEMTNDRIAKTLFISEGTVKQTLSAIQTKLGVSGRVGIAATVSRAE